MLDAAGYQNITIYNLYYSGASLEKHYNWWKNDTKECKLLCQGEIIAEKVNINDVWSLRQWDYVSFLQASKVYNYTFDEAMNTITPYFGKLLSLAKENAPYAKIFWQESWASDIGFTNNFNMDSSEKQEAMASMIQRVSAQVSKSYGLPVVPLSSAWQALRNNEDFLDLAAARSENLNLDKITLCTRNINGKIDNDYDHDGDVGGGQYLNACIFYEMFTGKDCRENNFRPQYVLNSVDYSLTEAEIVMLQEAAHNAVHPNN